MRRRICSLDIPHHCTHPTVISGSAGTIANVLQSACVVVFASLYVLSISAPGFALKSIGVEHIDLYYQHRKMQTVLGGAAPNLADAIAVHVVFAGLSMVGGDLQYAGIDNEMLRQHLLDGGRRLPGRPRR